MFGTRRNFVRSENQGTPYLVPISLARFLSASQIATRSAIRLWRKTRTWFSPQKPVPMTPTATRFKYRRCLFLKSCRRGRPSEHLKLPELSSDHKSPPVDSFRSKVDQGQAPRQMTWGVQQLCSWPSRRLLGGCSRL